MSRALPQALVSRHSLRHFLALQLSARGVVWGWFGVDLLRASLRYHRLGRRFWPIVAGIYGALFLIGAAWIVVSIEPKITATAITRVIGTYP